MKKGLWIGCFLMGAVSAHAQMVDVLGNIGIQGTLATQDAQNVGKMNKETQVYQAFRDLNLKIVDIETTYFGDYSLMPTSTFESSGLKAQVKAISNGRQFSMTFNPMNAYWCNRLIMRGWDGLDKIVVNGRTYEPSTITAISAEICPLAQNHVQFIF